MTGRELPPTSAFSGDDGSADPGLSAALAEHAAGGPVAPVVAALAGTRVLVPVLAESESTVAAESSDADGHEHTVDRQASAGIVALQAPDGRTALPVFSSVASMAAWRADARPVPSEIARAALSAVDEGWELLVLDPGGPVTVLIPRPAVWALAQQTAWVPAVTGVGDERTVDPQVRQAIRTAIEAVLAVGEPETEQPRRRWWQRSAAAQATSVQPPPAVQDVVVLPGDRSEVEVRLHLAPGLDRGTVDTVLRAVAAALAGDDTVTRRVDAVQVRLR